MTDPTPAISDAMRDMLNEETFVEHSYEHRLIGEELAWGVAMLVACLILSYYVEKNIERYPWLTYMNDTNVAILLGAIGGVLLRILPNDMHLRFEPEILYYVLLPPIIFEAGYSLQKRHFFENFGTILFLAIFGTFVATFVTAFIMYAGALAGIVPHLDTSKGMYDSLLFGALISVVDPVATLAVLNSHSNSVSDPMLPSIMFGESVLVRGRIEKGGQLLTDLSCQAMRKKV